MATRRSGSTLALAVLAMLLERPMHPYEVGRVLRERGKQESIKINYGTLYLAFDQLAEAGYVEPVETQREDNRPERTVYALTPTGRAELRRWMRELVSTPTKEYPNFVGALSLLVALPPAEVPDLLRKRLIVLDEQIGVARRNVEQGLQHIEGVFLIEDEYRIAQLEIEKAFVTRLIERIETDEPHFGRLWRQFHEQEK